MADWSLMEREWHPNPYDPYQYYGQYCQGLPPPPCLHQHPMPPPPQPPPPAQSYHTSYSPLCYNPSTSHLQPYNPAPPKPDNPREIRNKAEKQRRDKLNQSISQLASMVPPVVAASRKIDKTGVLRLTAHYLRAHQYVFGDSVNREDQQQFSARSTRALLSILNGFLLTTTYRGLIVVVSQNVQQYLGYSELDLLGQNIFNIIHEEDRRLMRDMLMPKADLLGPNGELLVPDEPESKNKLAEQLATDKRRFIVRFKKLSQRSEPNQYVTCHVEGTLRKSDRACRGYNRCCQMVRRARARADNPCNSGNDVVFVGIVRMASETFITESHMESCRMEYRTRHSVDGQIIQCERRISLVTGYMTHEVNGVNAMNFMHRDDVRWVVIALREMYDQHRLFGESCYRLLTKNGQFIYMRTRGRLDVDPSTREVTSFVCTNTVVDEVEGKQLIKIMKKKFTLMVNNNEEPVQEEEEREEVIDTNDQNVSVEDPRQLEKVILHLVTNLPSPPPTEDSQDNSPDRSSPSGRLAIIPPKKEKIVSAIEKIYSVINTFPKNAERAPKPQTAQVVSNPPSDMIECVSNNLIMNYSMQSTSHSPQLVTETQNLCPEPPLPTLPNFSNYPQHLECNGSMEYNTSMFSASVTNQDMMTQAAADPSTSYPNAVNILGNATNSNFTNVNGEYNNDTFYYNSIVDNHGNEAFNEGNIMFELNKPNTAISGVKRQRDCPENTEVEAAYKKKSADDNKIEMTNGTILDDLPTLDTFFDETLFNTSFTQMESKTLEQNMDPIFPELLVSQEVQDILREIENAPEKPGQQSGF